MKNIMKKSVGVILILLTLLYTLTGCYLFEYSKGYGVVVGEFAEPSYAKVKSNKRIFEKDDVTLDFYYGLYSLNGMATVESKKALSAWETSDGDNIEIHFAIFLSDSDKIVFEQDENENILDFENKVNAKLWKYISYEAAFSKDYGFTYEKLTIDYHHNEKITIPQDMFHLPSGNVFIHIIGLRCINKETFIIGPEEVIIRIEYQCFDTKVVLN